MTEATLLVAWFACFVGVALLSVAEVAIIRVRRGVVLVDADAGRARARRLLALIDDLPVVLNTIFLVVLFLQVSIATIGGYLAQRWFGNTGVTAATVVTTAFLFLYAEAIPKTMAVKHPQRMALRVTRAVSVLVRALGPVVGVLVWLADKQTPGTSAAVTGFSERELRALTQEAAASGVIDDQDAALVDRSFEFGDRSVGEVMVARDAIAAVDVDQTVAEALAVAVDLGHRRLPVCDGGIDHVVGLVSWRALAALARTAPETQLAAMVSPVLTCGPDLPISELLQRMQRSGGRLAIVVGAGGLTVGLATIEDLVAELVGEIADRHAP
ncbi:MAG: CNNM domain-containing protein [Actinomycetota bacterium]